MTFFWVFFLEVFSCPHGPTENIFEGFLAVRMEVNKNILEVFLAVRMELNENIFEGFNYDDKRQNRKKTKCVSNDRSRHDDQNEYRIIKIGAILEG